MKNYKWVNPYSKSKEDIMGDLMKSIKSSIPEITDFSPSNSLMVLIESFAAVGEMVAFNIDYLYRENFTGVAQLYSSMVLIADKYGYNLKLSNPSSTQITIDFLDAQGNLKVLTSDYVIPADSIFSTGSIEFTTIESYRALAGSSSITIPILQVGQYQSLLLGESSNASDQLFKLPEGICLYDLSITGDDNSTLKILDSLANSLPTELACTITMKEDGNMYVILGDGIHGRYPIDGVKLYANHRITRGASGNVPAMSITTNSLTVPSGITTVSSYNKMRSSGGCDLEDISALRRNIPYHISTLHRAVTLTDYEKLSQILPGVKLSRATFKRFSGVTLHIYPTGGGLPSDLLKQAVLDYFEDITNMRDVNLTIKPTGESYLVTDLTLYILKGVNKDDVTVSVTNKLAEMYSPNSSGINKQVYLSDLVSALDSHPGIDHLKVNEITYTPYCKPKGNSPEISTLGKIINVSSNTTLDIKYDGTDFEVYRGAYLIGTFAIDTDYTTPDGELLINIPSSNQPSLSTGDTWTISLSPVNGDIVISDYSVPIFLPENITIQTDSQWS